MITSVLVAICFGVPGFILGARGRLKQLGMAVVTMILVILTGGLVAGYFTNPMDWVWGHGLDALGVIAVVLMVSALPGLVVGAMAGVVAAVAFGFGVGDGNRKNSK